MYYRIKKEWQDGRWSKDQKGSYSTEAAAIRCCTPELIAQGYKVFSPEGEVIFPIVYNELAKQMVKDGVTVDVGYWSDVFEGKQEPNVEYIQAIVKRYSDKLNAESLNGNLEINNYGDLAVLAIPSSRFRIVWGDCRKTTLCNQSVAFNLGYFANYREGDEFFTLPSGNLVADIEPTLLSNTVLKYLKERKLTDDKLYFSASQNASAQFRGKAVSTLFVYTDGTVKISRAESCVGDNVAYAVSGAPVIINGKAATEQDVLVEGWDNSIQRATYHGLLATKAENPNTLYYFYLKTVSSKCISSEEIYDRIKTLGFDNVIKVDGGGSFYYKNGNSVCRTSEDRQINNFGAIKL